MKQITEQERVAARALARRLVREFEVAEWHRSGNVEECSRRVSESVQQCSRKYGISPLLLKSAIYRLRRGIE